MDVVIVSVVSILSAAITLAFAVSHNRAFDTVGHLVRRRRGGQRKRRAA